MKNSDSSLPLFFKFISCLFVFTLVTSTIVVADEGNAAGDNQAAVQAADSGVPASDEASASSNGSGKLANAWSNTKKFFSNGVSLGNTGGFTPRIRPHLHGESSYNSNTTLGRSNSAAWEGRISPGVTVDLPFGEKLYGEVGYTYTYSTTQGRRVSTHSNGHTIDALMRYDVSNKTAAGVRNSTRWNEMPGQPGNTFFLETINPEVKHQFGEQLSASLDYIYQHYGDVTPKANGSGSDFFRSAISNDSFNDNGISTSTSYKVGPNLGIGPSFAWRVRDFTKTNTKDYWQIEPTLGGTYRLGPKTKLASYFGWAYRSFDVGDGYESELVYGASVTHLLGKKVNWGLSYDKSLTDTFDTSFVFKPVSPEASNLDSHDRHFRAIKNHRISTNVGYNINEKNNVSANFAYQHSSADNNDNVISNDRMTEQKIETGITYLYRLTKYIGLQLGYAFGRSFEAKDNPTRSQYTFHKIIAGVNVAF